MHGRVWQRSALVAIILSRAKQVKKHKGCRTSLDAGKHCRFSATLGLAHYPV